MDLRSIPITVTGPGSSLIMELTAAASGFTVGNRYEVIGLVVDTDPALPKPKPYAVTFTDAGVLDVVDVTKLRKV